MKWRRALLFVAAFALTGCFKDESLTGYGAANRVWLLQTIDEAPFTASAHLTFPSPGRIEGQASCNSFSANQTAPYPWFTLTVLIATEMACNDLAAEAQFFEALEQMSLSEVLGDTLILSNDAGRQMVFRAAP